MTLPRIGRNCRILESPAPRLLHSGSLSVTNAAPQLTGLLASPHLTPRKDVLMPAGLKEPRLGEAQQVGTHPVLEEAGHLSCSDQGWEYRNWESPVRQTQALQAAPGQCPVLAIQLHTRVRSLLCTNGSAWSTGGVQSGHTWRRTHPGVSQRASLLQQTRQWLLSGTPPCSWRC